MHAATGWACSSPCPRRSGSVRQARGDRPRQLGLLVYGLSLSACYAASALDHGWTGRPETIAGLRQLDHVGIYGLIAGTYTPIAWSSAPRNIQAGPDPVPRSLDDPRRGLRRAPAAGPRHPLDTARHARPHLGDGPGLTSSPTPNWPARSRTATLARSWRRLHRHAGRRWQPPPGARPPWPGVVGADELVPCLRPPPAAPCISSSSPDSSPAGGPIPCAPRPMLCEEGPGGDRALTVASRLNTSPALDLIVDERLQPPIFPCCRTPTRSGPSRRRAAGAVGAGGPGTARTSRPFMIGRGVARWKLRKCCLRVPLWGSSSAVSCTASSAAVAAAWKSPVSA